MGSLEMTTLPQPVIDFFYLSDVNLNDGGRGYAWGEDYGNYYNGYNINRYSNPNVTWEVAKKTNYGLELELLEFADDSS